MKKKFIRGSVIGATVFVVTVILYFLNVFQALEWKSWDLRLRLLADSSKADPNIALILIDQKSLDIYENEQGIPWPWPREMYSYIVEYCRRSGAQSIVFDLTFSEISSWGEGDDFIFAQAMSRAENVILPFSFSSEDLEIETVPLIFLNNFPLTKVPVSSKGIIPMASATLPLEDYIASVQGLGNVNLLPDKDSIYRRIALVFRFKDRIFPSLPLAVVNSIKDDGFPIDIPLDQAGKMIVSFHGAVGTYPAYSAAAVINSLALMEAGEAPQIPPEKFSNKIVLIGGSAPGLLDLRPTPFNAVASGVEIQAASIDTLLNENFIRIPAQIVLFFFVAIMAVFIGLTTSLVTRIWKIVLYAVAAFILPVIIVSGAFIVGYWMEFVAPEFAVILSFTIAVLTNYNVEGKKKRFIKNVFRHYLSHDVIERVIQNPSLLALGGENREISSFFSDLAGFTTISENLSPEELVHLLNAYLSEMTDIILDTGGTLDKYEGDAIIAFWNAPLDQTDHAKRAARAALRCQTRLSELRPSFKKTYGHELFMRIGINSGPAVVGNMGSKNRFDYTAIGDTVNLASRLEGVCKQYQVPILIGEATNHKIIAELTTREVDIIRVVGKKKSIHVYELIGEKKHVSRQELEAIEVFHQALFLYRNMKWDKALNLFKRLKDDKLALVYVDRVEKLKTFPPPEDWAGVFELKQK